jgi:hypothetical protein
VRESLATSSAQSAILKLLSSKSQAKGQWFATEWVQNGGVVVCDFHSAGEDGAASAYQPVAGLAHSEAHGPRRVSKTRMGIP